MVEWCNRLGEHSRHGNGDVQHHGALFPLVVRDNMHPECSLWAQTSNDSYRELVTNFHLLFMPQEQTRESPLHRLCVHEEATRCATIGEGGRREMEERGGALLSLQEARDLLISIQSFSPSHPNCFQHN